MATFEEIKKIIYKTQNEPTKVLMVSRYKGKGRPRNSDYQHCLFKDILYVKCLDRLMCGFSTTYS